MKLEIAALVTAMFGASAFIVVAEPMESKVPLDRADKFTNTDYQAFDRDFLMAGKPCHVGIAKHKLCFQPSPLQEQLVEGDALKSHIPVMAAEFPILVQLPPKASHQKLLRYGTKLVLMNEETQILEDIIELDMSESA